MITAVAAIVEPYLFASLAGEPLEHIETDGLIT